MHASVVCIGVECARELNDIKNDSYQVYTKYWYQNIYHCWRRQQCELMYMNSSNTHAIAVCLYERERESLSFIQCNTIWVDILSMFRCNRSIWNVLYDINFVKCQIHKFWNWKLKDGVPKLPRILSSVYSLLRKSKMKATWKVVRYMVWTDAIWSKSQECFLCCPCKEFQSLKIF